ncbi:MAG: hypothetical protein ACI3XG_01125 [Faecousia sp.]
MAKEIKLKTRRLTLTPMLLGELDRKVLLMEEGEERQAYQQMLDGCREKPQDWLWYAPWKIMLKQDGTVIGDICFKGAPKKAQWNGVMAWTKTIGVRAT